MGNDEEVRMDIPDYLDKMAERVWEQYGDEMQDSDDLEEYLADKLSMLDPTDGEIEILAERLRRYIRHNARPADNPPETNPMYAPTDAKTHSYHSLR